MSDAASTASRAENPALDRAVRAASDALIGLQRGDGHWAFELEADATIPAEFMLLQHYLDEIDDKLQARAGPLSARHPGRAWRLAAVPWRRFQPVGQRQSLFRAEGARATSPTRRIWRARAQAILAHGGAAQSNVFTRIQLALFGELPWQAVPVMPVEIMLLPRWFPFHLSKVSYWSRTVIVPLWC